MSQKIKYIQIYGERNSGTNYLHNMLEQNFKGVKIGYKYGWKHGFAKTDQIQLADTGNELFIAIWKSPYAWFVSMNGKPHHAPQLYGLPFSKFIKSEWACYEGENYDKRDLKKDPIKTSQEMMFERNPNTGLRFQNAITLRNAKSWRFLELGNVVENFETMRYEDLLWAPKRTISMLAKKYDITLKGPIKLESGYFGKNPNKKFTGKSYYLHKKFLEKYSKEDLDYTNLYIDSKLEEKIGYDVLYSYDELIEAKSEALEKYSF